MRTAPIWAIANSLRSTQEKTCTVPTAALTLPLRCPVCLALLYRQWFCMCVRARACVRDLPSESVPYFPCFVWPCSGSFLLLSNSISTGESDFKLYFPLSLSAPTWPNAQDHARFLSHWETGKLRSICESTAGLKAWIITCRLHYVQYYCPKNTWIIIITP
jgi:hypothetical protein